MGVRGVDARRATRPDLGPPHPRPDGVVLGGARPRAACRSCTSPTSTSRVRADPFIVKGEALWAEHHCDAAMQQWSIGNETYASAIDDPDEALGRAYGDPTPIAFDLEWYATA